MASSLSTKLRIAASVLFATGFFDAIAGRFLWEPHAKSLGEASDAKSATTWQDLAGAVHIHSNYSDGASDVPTVMAAAAEAGVDWLLLTDHNTQLPLREGWEQKFEDRPLLLIGTEVTVEKGAFLLALDMPASWEPTKHQKPQVAIDEVNAHGGLPLVSLPFDVKHPWYAWDATGYDGLEVINLSTIARRHINLLSLAWILPLVAQGGHLAALKAIIARPDDSIARWDALMENGTRSMIGLGALDAHALMKIGKKKYPIPSYADSFRATTTHVLLPPEIPVQGEVCRRAIYEAIRRGRCYMAFDCLGETKGFAFSANGGTVMMGERVSLGAAGVPLVAHTGSPSDRVLMRLLKNGRVVAAGAQGVLRYRATEPGAYRIEAYRYAGRVGAFFYGTRPWIFSNPIYISA